jgi:hypothetical protein
MEIEQAQLCNKSRVFFFIASSTFAEMGLVSATLQASFTL